MKTHHQTYQVADFHLRLAAAAEIPALVEHYNAIVAVNNAKPGRYIDWAPFAAERLAPAVDDQRLLIVEPRTGLEAPSISAAIIIDQAPDPQFWLASELPAHAVGFSKLGVSASLLGHNFGRTIAMPLVVQWALQQKAEALYCDALPHLDNYYKSLGFEKVGAASFFSDYHHKEVIVHKHTRNLGA